MAPKFPNPPLTEISPKHLVTAEQAADWFGIEPVTIRRWVHTGKVEALPIPGGPALFYHPVLAQAELDAWENGADREARGGRKPGWRPCQQQAA